MKKIYNQLADRVLSGEFREQHEKFVKEALAASDITNKLIFETMFSNAYNAARGSLYEFLLEFDRLVEFVWMLEQAGAKIPAVDVVAYFLQPSN